MKTVSTSLLCVLLCASSVFAQNDFVIYGLGINLSDDPLAVLTGTSVQSIDLQSIYPNTGQQNVLFSIEGARSVAAGSSTFNADQDQYFFWGNDAGNAQRIYSLDLGKSEVTSSPETDDIIVDIEYNYANGKVYGLRLTAGDSSDPFNPGFNDLDLVEVDSVTGALTVISELPDTQATGQGNSTFDPINNRFIFLSFNNGAASVVGIDVTTGETAFNTNLDSVDGQVLAFEYDWTNQRLLGIRQTSTFDLTDPFFLFTSMENFLVEIDVDTGEVNDISTTPAFVDTGVAIGGVAFHQESGTFITYIQGTTLGMISAETGQVVNTVALPDYVYEIQVDNLAFARSLNLRAVELGDVNRDGTVSFLDVSSFVALLSAEDYQIEADITQDGELNFLDIAPFIQILNGN